MEGCKRLKSKESRDKSIADVLAAHNEHSHLKGETLPASQQLYRVKVLSCFLCAVIPLQKFDHFHGLLWKGMRCVLLIEGICLI